MCRKGISTCLQITTPDFWYVYLMHKKFDALDKFIEFKEKSENQLGKHIKALQFDQGGEYMSTWFDSFLKAHRIMFPIECTWNFIKKWSSGKKKLNIDGHG